MKKLLLAMIPVFCLCIFSSCKKEYTYELYAETGMFSSLADTKVSEEIIKELNDSSAFETAHRNFLILMNLKFNRDKNFHPEIYYFKLINPEGKDISSGSFLTDVNAIKERNERICLSSEFKNYIKDIKE